MATKQQFPQSASAGQEGEAEDRTVLMEDARNWEHLQELFHQVEALSREDRTIALEAATTDAGLRARVLGLLETEDVFEQAFPGPPGPPVEGRVGPYALLRHLGSGGLGSVYLSERVIGGAIQQCAVKLLSTRGLEPAFRSRFHREQQILATLNHPNITRLLDAGISATNQPYLVMDFVDGVELTTHCNERHLSVEQRLVVFLSVCNAVAYAHRNLIVHLDLKPSNILVTDDGTAKLLDFGTSKLIAPDSAITTTVLATPAYASPEQLRGEAVTTGCDVYSLGAVLYELLTGQRPFRITSMAMAVNHAAREDEPEPITSALTAAVAASFGTHLEKLRHELRGDLASIVARCLRSRPQDRYVSVDALSADLKRYLDGRPVAARRQTTAYRLSKFVRRNWGTIAVAAAVLVVVAAAGTFSYLRQQQALRQGRRAEQMQTFMTRLLRLSHSGATGKPAATVAEMLQVGAQILPSFISDPADLRAARMNMAESMYDDDDFKDALPILLDLVTDAKQSGDLNVEAKAEVLAGDIDYLTGKVSDGNTLTSDALDVAQNRSVSPDVRTEATTIYVSDHDDVGDRGERSMQMLQRAIVRSGARACARGPGSVCDEHPRIGFTSARTSFRSRAVPGAQPCNLSAHSLCHLRRSFDRALSRCNQNQADGLHGSASALQRFLSKPEEVCGRGRSWHVVCAVLGRGYTHGPWPARSCGGDAGARASTLEEGRGSRQHAPLHAADRADTRLSSS